MLPPRARGPIRALQFTYHQHEALFLCFFAMLGAAVVLPAAGWVGRAEASQFPLVMSGLGIGWALLFIWVQRGKAEHLAAWERLTIDYPFRACPLYRYTEADDPQGQWRLVQIEDFETPIRTFGMDYVDLQHLLLGVMLIAYFTVLQLVK